MKTLLATLVVLGLGFFYGLSCYSVVAPPHIMDDVFQFSVDRTVRRAPGKVGAGKSRARGALSSRVGGQRKAKMKNRARK